MRTRLFGVLVAAMAISAFAVLPTVAMGVEPVTLRSEGEPLEVGAEVKSFSSNLKFTTSTGISVECEESEIIGEVIENPGAEVEVTESSFLPAGPGDMCKSNVARLEFRVRNANFRTPVYYHAVPSRSLTHGLDRTRAHYTVMVWDRAISKTIPRGECTYEGPFTTRYKFNTALVGGNLDEVVGGTMALEAGDPQLCPSSGTMSGGFEVTSEGAPVEIHM